MQIYFAPTQVAGVAMGVFGKLSEAEGVFAFADRVVKWSPFVLGLGGFGGLGAWATHAAKAFEQYSPFSWVFGGFFGVLLFALIYWLWSLARKSVATAEFIRHKSAQKDSINPLENTFNRQTIDLNVFHGPLGEHAVGKTFIGCDLDGPAVVCFFGNLVIHGVEFGDCDFVLIGPEARIHNGIGFRNTTITGGRIRRVTILVQPAIRPALEAGFNAPANINWLTPPA